MQSILNMMFELIVKKDDLVDWLFVLEPGQKQRLCRFGVHYNFGLEYNLNLINKIHQL